LPEPSYQDLDKAVKEVGKMVQSNKKQKKRTFFLFFYAGHGAMLNN